MRLTRLLVVTLIMSFAAQWQSLPAAERKQVFAFDSKGVGLTETILRFSHQFKVPMAIEYTDEESMNRPLDVSVRSATAGQALNSILHNETGYTCHLRDGIYSISHVNASRRAEKLLNTVIPMFTISEGETVLETSIVLSWDLEVASDPAREAKGFGVSALGRSSTVKPATFHNRTVREILSYIVLNSEAEGWIVTGPQRCLGYTPYCGLWFFVEGEPFDFSYQTVLGRIRRNF
jgi:hypothetical protein